MQVRHAASVAAVLSFVAAGLIASPSSATVVREEPFSGTDAYEYSDCGYPISVEAEFSGRVSFRVAKNLDASVMFFRQRLQVREVHTNPETGEYFVFLVNEMFLDVKATRVEGSLYELTSHEAGQPFVIEDSDGNVVVRDRGLVSFHALVDIQPGGGLQFVDFLGADVHGPHDAFFNPWCSFAGQVAGISTSSARYSVRPEGSTASRLGYAEYLPPDYDQPGQSPLLVFLHGFGESGNGSAEELQRLAYNALPGYAAYNGWPDERPFVVLSPQHEAPADLSGYDEECAGVPEFFGSCAMRHQHDLGNPAGNSPCFTPDEVHDFIAYAVSAYDVDPHRVYLTGLSCGAFGGWEYLEEHGNEQVAAAVLIAGEGRPAWETVGCALGDVPLWAFHGLLDEEVNPLGSIVPLQGLQACGDPDALLTTYPDADHDSWTRTYAVGSAVDIYNWMLGFTNP